MTLTADELLVIHKAIGRCEEYDACDYCLYEKACNELVEKVNEQQPGRSRTMRGGAKGRFGLSIGR